MHKAAGASSDLARFPCISSSHLNFQRQRQHLFWGMLNVQSVVLIKRDGRYIRVLRKNTITGRPSPKMLFKKTIIRSG